MTVANTERKAGPYATDGAQTAFAFSFKVFDEEDVLVTTTEDTTETELVYETDYTVSLNSNQDDNPGGTVTISPALNGPTVTLTSDMDYAQPVVLTNAGAFYPRVLNDALDRVTILAQQLKEKLGRALLSPLDSESMVGLYPVVTAEGTLGFSEGTGADAGLRADLANSTGLALLGYALGGSAQQIFDAIGIVVRPSGGDDTAAIVAALALGDTVYCRNGSFTVTEKITVTGKTLDFTGSTITFDGWTGGVGVAAADAGFLLGTGTTVIGGTFDGEDQIGHCFRLSGSRIKIEKPTIKQFTREGIRVLAGCSKIEINGVDIDDIGTGQAAAVVCNGIYITGTGTSAPTYDVTVRGGRITNINYADHTAETNDCDGIQIQGTDSALVLDPSDPSYSDAVTNVVVDGVYFENIDRRAVKMQSSFVTVTNCTAKNTGGFRPVGAGKKLKGLIVNNNRIINSAGFINGGAMVLDSQFNNNHGTGIVSSFWNSSSNGTWHRCTAQGNVMDMDGANAVSTSNCIFIGSVSYGGLGAYYDSDLTFKGNKFYRAGNSAHAAANKVAFGVWPNATNIEIDGCTVKVADSATQAARLRAPCKFTNNSLPVTGHTAGIVLLEDDGIEYRGNTPSGVAKGSATIASGNTTEVLNHNFKIFGSSGADAVFTRNTTEFPALDDIVRITVQPTNTPTNAVQWSVEMTDEDTATLTLSGDPGAAGFDFRWKAEVLG